MARGDQQDDLVSGIRDLLLAVHPYCQVALEHGSCRTVRAHGRQAPSSTNEFQNVELLSPCTLFCATFDADHDMSVEKRESGREEAFCSARTSACPCVRVHLPPPSILQLKRSHPTHDLLTSVDLAISRYGRQMPTSRRRARNAANCPQRSERRLPWTRPSQRSDTTTHNQAGRITRQKQAIVMVEPRKGGGGGETPRPERPRGRENWPLPPPEPAHRQ